MSFIYERDDVHHRVVIRFEGAFQMREALASIERRRAEDTWSRGVLYDLRQMSGQPGMAELRQLLSEDLAIPAGGERGPLAVVAAASSVYTKACTFAALAQSKVRVRVFSDIGEADSWLTMLTDNPYSRQEATTHIPDGSTS
jgi:hypothetical protein